MAQAIPAILGALSNQTSRRPESSRPMVETALPVLSASEKKRLKKLMKEADKERLYNLLVQPEVLGLILTLGGMFAAQNIPFSSDPASNEALQAAATSASVLLGLGYAGVGDLTTLLVAAGAGGGSLFGSLFGDIDIANSIPGLQNYGLGPLGGLIRGII